MTADRDALLDRALLLLTRFALEQTGWRGWLRRWYYSDEPLRNDAANIVRASGFPTRGKPYHTRLVGDADDR